VDKQSRPGNIRVYAGHFKVPYAHFVEYGTVNQGPRSFMREPFGTVKVIAKKRIENAISEEVRMQI
jgi:hypothetical protein